MLRTEATQIFAVSVVIAEARQFTTTKMMPVITALVAHAESDIATDLHDVRRKATDQICTTDKTLLELQSRTS